MSRFLLGDSRPRLIRAHTPQKCSSSNASSAVRDRSRCSPNRCAYIASIWMTDCPRLGRMTGRGEKSVVEALYRAWVSRKTLTDDGRLKVIAVARSPSP